jgi:hypothetical protein
MSDNDLANRLAFLKTGIDAQLQLGLKIMKAYGGAVYPLDLVSSAVLHRSMSLIAGFCAMIEAHNFICAAPLLRLQIDNLLRFYAALIVSDPHEFAIEVFRGKQIRDLLDAQGKKMTDHYLVTLLSKEYDWIARVYKHTSGYIHLSSKHIFNTIHNNGTTEGKISISAGQSDEFIPDSIRLEAVEAMIAVTQALNRYLERWAFTKDNPSFAQKEQHKGELGKASP